MATLKAGSDEQFGIVRRLLERTPYSGAEIAARTGRRPEGYLSILPGSLFGGAPARDALEAVTRVFLAGDLIGVEDLAQHLTELEIESLLELGLLARWDGDQGRCFSPVALYPVGDVWVISDRWTNPDLGPIAAREDSVYPVTDNTLGFLATLPKTPCRKFLEMCGGTGAAALLARRHYAAEAWTLDITARATEFASFAARLNGLDQCHALEGDLYDPVAGLTFDRIVAHPPYVPALARKNIYSDAGEDGQEVTRRLVEQAPRFLEPGGRCYIATTGLDRGNQPYEQCLRNWLGASSAECDVAVFVRNYQSPREVAQYLAVRAARGQDAVAHWMEQFRLWQVTDFVYCFVVLQKRAPAGAAFTIRRDLSGPVSGEVMERLVDFEARATGSGFSAWYSEVRPKVPRRVRMQIVHRFIDGEVRPEECVLRVDAPFEVECRIEPWTVYVLSRADGSRTVAELYEDARSRELLPEAGTLEEFADLIRTLQSGGFIEEEGSA
jgi:SAM-dependent methyltransferase